ncbi:MAG: hypothetical protein VX583_09940 [Bdellovibrionota bacterium]|nr:hypothetical protein [Pseudobdellovibrionaceae bacterium]|tara:strand:- start:23811 stop:27905 length:4095 start_codon:yes stop_codon:yes gene_type:complete
MGILKHLLSQILIFQFLLLPIPRSAFAAEDSDENRFAAPSASALGSGFNLADPASMKEALADDKLQELSPEIFQHIQNQKSMIEKFESGELAQEEIRKFDYTNVTQQSLEYYDFNSDQWLKIDFHKDKTRLRKIAYTRLDYEITDGVLSVVAYQGNQKVARQNFYGLDVVSVVRDAEFLMLIGRDASLHAVFMPLAASHMFRSPVFVTKNIINLPQELDATALKANFLHRGFRPIDFTNRLISESSESAIFKTDYAGRPLVDFGDLAIENSETGELVGVFSRKVMYSRVLNMVESLMRQLIVSAPEVLPADVLKAAADSFLKANDIDLSSDKTEREQAEVAQRIMSQNLDKGLISAVMKVAGEIESLEAREVDRASYEEWVGKWVTYDERAKELAREYEGRKKENVYTKLKNSAGSVVNKLAGEVSGPKVFVDSELDYQNLLKQISEKDYGARSGGASILWQDIEKENSLSEELTVRSNLLKRTASILKSPMVAITLVGIFSGYHVLSHYSELQLKATAWLTNEAMPKVLTDFDYVGPNGEKANYSEILGLSVISLTLLIPIAMLVSWVSVPSMRLVAKALKKVDPERSSKLEHAAEDWKNLDVWQRIVTMGFRIFAVICLPFFHYLALFTNQRNLIPTMKMGMNPFKVVKNEKGERHFLGVNNPIQMQKSILDMPESISKFFTQLNSNSLSKEDFASLAKDTVATLTPSLGKYSSLSEARQDYHERLGYKGEKAWYSPEALKHRLGAPFSAEGKSFAYDTLLSRESKTVQITEMQRQALGKEVGARERASSIAWILATKIVASESNIDLATLMTVTSEGIDPSETAKIFSDPDLKRTWQKHVYEIQELLVNFDVIYDENKAKDINLKEVIDIYESVLKVSEEINSRSTYQNVVKNMKMNSIIGTRKAISGLATFAVADNEFLKRNFANKVVSGLVSKEFTTDHMGVVGIPAVIGERADINKQGELSAINNPWYLWTHPEHIQDVLNNMSLHFFQAGSQTALAIQGEPKVNETKYGPMELIRYASMDRAEPFFESSYLWFKSIAESRDAGEIFFKKMLSKRIVTAQGSMLLSVIFRVLVAKQSLGMALSGWYYFWIAGPLLYAWPWTLILLGMQGEEDRISENISRFNKEKMKIVNARRLSSDEELRERIRGFIGFYKKETEFLYRGFVHTLLTHRGIYNHSLQRIKTEKEFKKYLSMSDFIKGDISSYELDLEEIIQKADRKQLNALVERSLEYSVKHPAVYTKVHAAIGWLTVVGLGAVLTTVLAISVGVDSFNPETLHWSNLLWWTGVHTSFTFAVRAALKNRSLIDISKSFYRSVKYSLKYLNAFPGKQDRSTRHYFNKVKENAKGKLESVKMACRRAAS